MSCQARWADTQYEPHFLKLRAFISVAQAILAGKYGRFVRNLLPCASCLSILEQNLRGKPRLAVFTNPAGDVATGDARGKYFRLCHSEVCHETGNRKKLVWRFFLLRFEILFKPDTP